MRWTTHQSSEQSNSRLRGYCKSKYPQCKRFRVNRTSCTSHKIMRGFATSIQSLRILQNHSCNIFLDKQKNNRNHSPLCLKSTYQCWHSTSVPYPAQKIQKPSESTRKCPKCTWSKKPIFFFIKYYHCGPEDVTNRLHHFKPQRIRM